MASAFHLRPIHDGSTSPTASTSTASDRSPPSTAPDPAPPQPNTSAARSRRPLSPSSLRGTSHPMLAAPPPHGSITAPPPDVDLSAPGRDAGPRKYPAPPTGHELMALFPPSPPTTMRPGPTSGFFEREERAFFARKGKEIVRVRIEVDMPQGPDADDAKAKARDPAGARPWPQGPAHPAQGSPSPLHPIPFPHQNARARAAPGPMAAPGAFPGPPPAQPAGVHSPSGLQRAAYPVRSPREHHLGVPAKPLDAHADFRDDTDESWRQPIPPSERRRAGKHTKRVIVK
ncbi:hypothetical protein OBBRIDRAFT_833342 [Obba rivulosa]|uniref:Uncharacterized protein n=1 Tax=Obba rivulosa TaxID=1052685 RepID=A0A8E2B4U5_9APHY|nr:hypothetical protein OBBRIDRAFT_833342 [Obba rivulosa]